MTELDALLQAQGAAVLLPEVPLHTVWHYGKLYQWSRRINGQHIMRPAAIGAPDADYQVGVR